eukprot:15442590-Alexandrium_andersonii.AAC.1
MSDGLGHAKPRHAFPTKCAKRAALSRRGGLRHERGQLTENCEIASGVRTWKCAGPGTTQNPPLKLPRGAFCAVSHTESDGGNVKYQCVRRRRFSGWSGGAVAPPPREAAGGRPP